MASMGDIYLVGKSDNQTLLAGLGEDFKNWFITSTRIKYGDKSNGRIIHHFKNRLIRPVEHKVIIPEYFPQLLEKVLDTKEGLRFLQVLFETNDSAEQIKDTLPKLSGYPLNAIVVWSTKAAVRPTERAAGLFCDNLNFHIYNDYRPRDIGHARRVRVK